MTTKPSTFAKNYLGPYELLDCIGSGAIAKVMRARHVHPVYSDTVFAMKLLHDALGKDLSIVQLFQREAMLLALLRHSNIVQIFEVGVEEGQLFIAMEYVAGCDLQQLIARCQAQGIQLPAFLSIYIMDKVLSALVYAHEAKDDENNFLGLVHRDLNPSNILLSFDGDIKLADFGVAALTLGKVEQQRGLTGKVGYFAPEQFDWPWSIDSKGDQFSAAVIFFELLSNRRLFDAAETMEILKLNQLAKIPSLLEMNTDLPLGLQEILEKALSKKKKDRYGSTREFLKALQPFVPHDDWMALLLCALIRHLFVDNYEKHLKNRQQQLGYRQMQQGDFDLVILLDDPRHFQALQSLFAPFEIRCHAIFSVMDWQSFLCQKRPKLVWLDTTAKALSDVALVRALQERSEGIGLIATVPALEETYLQQAQALRAKDVLWQPYSSNRALQAVNAIFLEQAYESKPTKKQLPWRMARILLVCIPASLRQSLVDLIELQGHKICCVDSYEQALSLSKRRSFELVMVGATVLKDACLFVQQYRRLHGLALVPFLLLTEQDEPSWWQSIQLPERCQLLSRLRSLEEILERLQHVLQSIWQMGRLFSRFKSHAAVQIRYGGRFFAGEVLNISRGGAMVVLGYVPAVGTQIAFQITTQQGILSGTARVIRVDWLKTSPEKSLVQVGLAFEDLSENMEAMLNDCLKTLTLLKL